VTVDLTAGTATGEGTDVILEAEGVSGSGFDDVLVGSDADEFLYGGPGSDSLEGRGGHDRIYFGTGAERVLAGAGNDTLYDIDNVCSDAAGCGSEQDDSYDGGDGIDEVWYEAPVGVTVDLAAGTSTGAGFDTIANVEDVRGTRHDDRLLGDEGPNRLNAGVGDDYLDGRGGNDELMESPGVATNSSDEFHGGDGDDVLWVFNGTNTLHGGPGADELLAGAGRDTLYGDEGDDLLTSYDGDHAIDGGEGSDTADYGRLGAANVDLRAGSGRKPNGADLTAFGSDTLVSIENVSGSEGHDVLVGDDNSNELYGVTGSDDISGEGGDDLLDGGQGGLPGSSQPDRDVLDGGVGTDTCLNGEEVAACEA
jgi:Ca2+-binding RTX toxin-like protein